MTDLACDVLVVGGGATGVCAAYDLARRGLSVILAESGDLTTGTSGRFHGLLHSGARYAVNDPDSARECIQENRILRRIVPHIIEDTGGLFVAAAADPDDFVPRWIEGCHAADIDISEIGVGEARRQESALRADIQRVFRTPDGAVDGFDLGHAFARAAESYGARILIYQAVTALEHTPDGMRAALHDVRGGETQTLDARWVLNAAGPWAGEIAALAGYDLTVRWSRGVMVAMNTRWVNTILNRLRPPDDGDILVPVGTVSVIGTTSVQVARPDDTTIEAWEVTRMLDEGAALIAGFREARALRAWAGVRPLYEPPGQDEGAEGRGVKRTFSVIRHGPGLTSVVGGKLTTARLMAEQAVDDVCAGLGVEARCTTAAEALPSEPPARKFHHLSARLDALEHGRLGGALICECEMIGRHQLEDAIAGYAHVPSLDDLRRDLRLGMGPCQGGFCAVRAAGILREARDLPAAEAVESLRAFVAERFKGGRPLLWGQHLRQFLLDEVIYRRTLGLDLAGYKGGLGKRDLRAAQLPTWADDESPIPAGEGRRVVVIGAGLSGLAAAIFAVQAGARVTLIGHGLGRLILTPGPQYGMFAAHPGVTAFLEWCAAYPSLAGTPPVPGVLPTLLGIPQHVDGAQVWQAAGMLPSDSATLLVGFGGWRDFDPALAAGMLGARGIHVALPGVEGPWDLSPTELAHRFDDPRFRAEVARLVRGRLQGEARIGFPAVLGLHDPAVLPDMARLLERPVFEIPTLPPSVPGTRLFNTLKHWLLSHGARVQIGHPAIRPVVTDGRLSGVAVASAGRETIVRGEAFILATGGLYGGGLLSDDRGRVWEPVFDLPVRADADRSAWFRPDLLDPAGHPIHEFGLRVDDHLRPLAETGQAAYANLFAAGHLLGGINALVAGCDEGLDLASAFGAVRAALAGE